MQLWTGMVGKITLSFSVLKLISKAWLAENNVVSISCGCRDPGQSASFESGLSTGWIMSVWRCQKYVKLHLVQFGLINPVSLAKSLAQALVIFRLDLSHIHCKVCQVYQWHTLQIVNNNNIGYGVCVLGGGEQLSQDGSYWCMFLCVFDD